MAGWSLLAWPKWFDGRSWVPLLRTGSVGGIDQDSHGHDPVRSFMARSLHLLSRSSLFPPLTSWRGRVAVAFEKVVVPIFSGLGTSTATSEAWLQQSFSDTCSSPGSLLLQSCYRAFVKELSSLSSADLSLLGISLDDFPAPTSLLIHDRNADHIVLSQFSFHFSGSSLTLSNRLFSARCFRSAT